MKASLPKLLNSFVRHTAVRFTPRRPVSKIGDQGMSARDEIFVSRGFDASVRNAHGFSPCFRARDSTRRRLLRRRIFAPVYIAVGSFASDQSRQRLPRMSTSPPKGDKTADVSSGPLGATSGREQSQQGSLSLNHLVGPDQ